MLIYQVISNRYEQKLALTYRDNNLAKIVEITDSSSNTTFYEYNPDGQTKRKTVYRVPKMPEAVDDMLFKYKYDKNGRVATTYAVVKGRKYKLTTYQYLLR